MINKKTYSKIKKLYGSDSSWAIWSDPENKNFKTKSNIDDLACFKDEVALIKKIKTKYIFVGYNPAIHKKNKTQAAWSSFHSGDKKRSQDYKLRYALKCSEYWGSFITDLYPEIKSRNIELANIKISENDTRKAIKRLINIRDLLGGKATIVAIGYKTYEVLKRNPLPNTKLIRIKHYSCRINQDTYREEVLCALECNKNS